MRQEQFFAMLRGFWVAAALASLVALSSCSSIFPVTPTSPPSQVTGVAASDGDPSGTLIVSWSSASSATSYKIYRAGSSGGTYVEQASVGAVTSWTDAGATLGVHYWYRVAACNAVGCGPQSTEDEGYAQALPPQVPAQVAATDGASPNTITVSWQAVAGATSYRVYRADAAGGTFSLLGTRAESPLEDDGLLGDVHHWYRVAACNLAGCSALSAEDEGSTAVVVPSAPTWVAATDGSHVDKIGVTWSQVTAAAHYEVYRASSDGGEYSLLATVTAATSYDDSGLEPDAHFWYRVAACNSAGCSPQSERADPGYTQPVVPGVPTGVAATDGAAANAIDVTWSPVEGATSYQIYRASPPSTSYFFRATVLGGGVGSWRDRDLPAGTTYRYRISACNSMGCGDPSLDDEGSTSP